MTELQPLLSHMMPNMSKKIIIRSADVMSLEQLIVKKLFNQHRIEFNTATPAMIKEFVAFISAMKGVAAIIMPAGHNFDMPVISFSDTNDEAAFLLKFK